MGMGCLRHQGLHSRPLHQTFPRAVVHESLLWLDSLSGGVRIVLFLFDDAALQAISLSMGPLNPRRLWRFD